MRFGINTQYFDYEDYLDPIKASPLIKYISLEHGRTKRATFKVRKNTYCVSDSFFFDSQYCGEFYSIKDIEIDTQTIYDVEPGMVVFVGIIELDSVEDHYEANFYSFWDLTGQIGGILEIFDITLMLIVGYFNSKLMEFDIINDYHNLNPSKKPRKRVNERIPVSNEPSLNMARSINQSKSELRSSLTTPKYSYKDFLAQYSLF